ncbi:MAG: HAMP domain-containing histidine kinase [Rhodospirillales bacterium]|nr:HAMP domain-containing histidine kinase [Rhodospirillales bacterium]
MASNDGPEKNGFTRRHENDVLRDFAHEIRTPLNGMLGYSQMIEIALNEGADAEKIGACNENFKTATLRLLQICERVLDEAVSGEAVIAREPVDGHELATSVVDTFKALAMQRGIELTCDFPSDFPQLHTDPLLLGQALSNLVSNAIKFTPKGGSVKVRGERSNDDKALIFVVQDTGDGIPADLLLRMRRGEYVSTAHYHDHKGWGRGLRIADGLCKNIGASLSFEPARTGGTVAMITIPLDNP